MNDPNPAILRYLLGDMTEDERAALERRCFADPAVFEEVARVEAALVDDAARGRLDPGTRRRFEEFYLASPERRDRAAFALALVSKIDAPHAAREAGARPNQQGRAARRGRGVLETLSAALGGPRPALGLALAMLVVASGLAWFALKSRRPGPADSVATAPPEAPGPGAPAPGPGTSAPGAVVTLALLVGPGVRSGGAEPAILVLPPATAEVRLELRLSENDYPAYRVLIRNVGGADLLRTGDLAPATDPAAPAFVLTLQANRLDAGDYLLTLQGAAGDGAYEDLSQLILRVERP